MKCDILFVVQMEYCILKFFNSYASIIFVLIWERINCNFSIDAAGFEIYIDGRILGPAFLNLLGPRQENHASLLYKTQWITIVGYNMQCPSTGGFYFECGDVLAGHEASFANVVSDRNWKVQTRKNRNFYHGFDSWYSYNFDDTSWPNAVEIVNGTWKYLIWITFQTPKFFNNSLHLFVSQYMPTTHEKSSKPILWKRISLAYKSPRWMTKHKNSIWGKKQFLILNVSHENQS